MVRARVVAVVLPTMRLKGRLAVAAWARAVAKEVGVTVAGAEAVATGRVIREREEAEATGRGSMVAGATAGATTEGSVRAAAETAAEGSEMAAATAVQQGSRGHRCSS